MPKAYRHLFFDLDHTLWDFDTNSRLTLQEMYAEFKLAELGMPEFEEFLVSYRKLNERYWKFYQQGSMSKETLRIKRFSQTLNKYGLDDLQLADELSTYYLAHCPKKPNLLPYAIEVLDYLATKYKLHIITNGFSEVQAIKMQVSGLTHYFDFIVSSETAGAKKPHPGIFEYALSGAKTHREESLMIGDNIESDIKGAMSFGLDQVFFNPGGHLHSEAPTYEVSCLSELKGFL